MKEKIRQIIDVLNTDIFVGDRLEKNIRNMTNMCYIVMFIGVVMSAINLLQGDLVVALSPLVFLLTGALSLYFIRTRKSRGVSVVMTCIAIILVFSFDVIFVDNGFAFLWIMLVPLSVSYLLSVRSGILLSVYFELLVIVMFYTPLRGFVERYYQPIVLQRFPILYFFHILITGFVMYQYQKSIIAQIRYEAQLKDAVRAAEEANQAKSDFLANMSHEIRTPINTVLGLNQIISRDCREALSASPEDPAQDRAVLESVCANTDGIESAGGTLLSLINDVLDLSRIEAGRMELVNTAYTLSSLLSDVEGFAGFRAQAKGLAFSVDVAEAVPDELFGDPVRLKQVVVNLVSNAVKYTETGSVTVNVSMREQAPVRAGDAIHLDIAVRDTGIGIRREDLGHLFTRFERVDLQRNSSVEGTGLGLTITANLLEMMNGAIRVESEYGKGSSFCVTVPQTVVSAEPIGDYREKYRRGASGRRQYREAFRAPDVRILVVDDTPMNIRITAGLLKKTAVQVDSACSGEEALRKIAGRAYDLVLLDQRMPVMDGTEVLARIRETEAGKRLPVVCMTADAVSGAREKYLAEGFDDYLAKPIPGEELEKTLIRHLPREKVILTEAPSVSAPDAPDDYAPLRAAGIEPETGLKYCGSDEAFWREMLEDYAAASADTLSRLETAFLSRDWENYAILVHALKSTSRTIGASALAETAAAAEKAAKEKHEDLLDKIRPDLAEQYRLTAGAITSFLGRTDEAPASGDVLEFLPET